MPNGRRVTQACIEGVKVGAGFTCFAYLGIRRPILQYLGPQYSRLTINKLFEIPGRVISR
jgi:hypothetical protein